MHFKIIYNIYNKHLENSLRASYSEKSNGKLSRAMVHAIMFRPCIAEVFGSHLDWDMSDQA
jgi:hypothetical protein